VATLCDRKRLSEAVCGDDKMVTCMLPDALLVSAHGLTAWDWICIDSWVVDGLQKIDFEDLPIVFEPLSAGSRQSAAG
jgi:hypothetical protein